MSNNKNYAANSTDKNINFNKNDSPILTECRICNFAPTALRAARAKKQII